MDKALEAIQRLPAKYKNKIVVHLIPGDPSRLAAALDAALDCFSDLQMRSGQSMAKEQKDHCDTLALIRSELAAELLRLEGFDFAAAKARGKAEVDAPKEKKQKEWKQPVVSN
ncbi:MAG: hypothetical protein V7707_07605 [Motiliproteus sp.]